MRRVSTITVAGVATAALAFTLTACGESSTSSGGDKGVGLAFDVGGRDDHSFNESAARGVDKAKAELGMKAKLLTAKNGETEAEREQRLSSLADAGHNPVIGVGFNYSKSIEKVAKEYPKVTFGVVDSVAPGKNVVSMTFGEHEGSYLAGVAAALKSKTHKVAFIGGVNNALIQKFQAGFEQGAKAADPKVEVRSDYLSNSDKGFNDPAAAKEKAKGMLDSDFDVIYTAAGLSGNGSIEAIAAKKGAWAIGVDSDQYQQPGLAKYKDSILTSVVKNVDVAVFDLIKSVKDGKPLTGQRQYLLKDGGVSLSTSGGHIDDIKAQIEEAKKKIVDGQVKVKTAP
ncbi:BMP family lipoprotein [Streptomyces albireticuli]|uniref:BMP family ABC transporter substrate-binding protein n=1 Tax=Streptomyces albireticuli TaxID=1940 RepID=A0A2A2CXP5_9ACTN|nr:BMP family ABC transporter substrate-binding protein [Streptomyces albireticuli]MCD9142769.1 BMP family ABC transporter substrate-binding protein [Streptomyces albireticuli]MCD9162912.1 BMP family ABC transporter substrate-binding protein [Streptomyces albireticuli]MCD9192472.1 BMP family ABC transporter substrate-binding protein [Streptomyces albireticuli]PAU44973.1 BMP family ABC transporter substrate-binding protein [Streptomyces albireticuli]